MQTSGNSHRCAECNSLLLSMGECFKIPIVVACCTSYLDLVTQCLAWRDTSDYSYYNQVATCNYVLCT
jgi:hypothetical protein